MTDDLVDAPSALACVDVPGEPEVGRVIQCPPHGQLAVHDVVLGDIADAPPQRGVAGVETAVVVEDVALAGHPRAGESIEQRRLPGPRRTDDRHHRPGRQREGDVVQQDGAAAQAHRQAVGGERDISGVHVLLQAVAHQPVGVAPHHHDVALLQGRRG